MMANLDLFPNADAFGMRATDPMAFESLLFDCDTRVSKAIAVGAGLSTVPMLEVCNNGTSDPRTVVIYHRLMPVDARCRHRVEVGDVGRIQFQKATGIAFAPTVEGAALEHEDLIGTRS